MGILNMQFEKVDDDYLMYDGGATASAAVDKIPEASCDADDKCCKCIPLGFGVTLLGVFVVINGGLMAIAGISTLASSAIFGIICMALCVGPLYCAWRFLQWFRDKDSKETRERLPIAYLIQYVFYAVGLILGFLGTVDGSDAGPFISDIIEIGV